MVNHKIVLTGHWVLKPPSSVRLLWWKKKSLCTYLSASPVLCRPPPHQPHFQRRLALRIHKDQDGTPATLPTPLQLVDCSESLLCETGDSSTQRHKATAYLRSAEPFPVRESFWTKAVAIEQTLIDQHIAGVWNSRARRSRDNGSD